MQLSFWEKKQWFSAIDFCIVGAGIVGLSCALALREKFPSAKIVILERSFLPNGASTKNAGFACFGSLSEIISDLESLSESELVELVTLRKDGLSLLRSNLSDEAIDFKAFGGYECFFEEQGDLFQNCQSQISYVNDLLRLVFFDDVFSIIPNPFPLQKVYPRLIVNQFEGQIDTGKMMKALLDKVRDADIDVFNGFALKHFQQQDDFVTVTGQEVSFDCHNLLFATNGFARQTMDINVQPARAQVLITEPISNMPYKGTFHMDEGYYYFRNIGNQLLLGGGRNLDFTTEATDSMQLNLQIQRRLDQILHEVIFPNQIVKVQNRWTGIMGVGSKKPIVKQVSQNVFVGVRLGGMGVAIGSKIGKELAQKAIEDS